MGMFAYCSNGLSQKVLRIALITILQIMLIGTSSLVFALSTVTLKLDRGELDEATLGTGKFTVTRTEDGDIGTPLKVIFTFTGTATIGEDYTESDQAYVGFPNYRSLTIPANELFMSSTITPIKDNWLEGEETVIWTLAADNANYIMGLDTVAEMTIADDVAEVKLTLNDGTMDEATLGTSRFTVTRSSNGKLDAALTIKFTFTGTATIGEDYTESDQAYVGFPNFRSLTIPANELFMSSTITPIKDNRLEGEETVIWTLAPDNNTYTVGSDTVAEMTIADDVAEVKLTLDDGTLDETKLGTGKFTVTRSSNGKLDAALTIKFTFTGTATIGEDYTESDQAYVGFPNFRSLTIPANELFMSSIITPVRDSVIEDDETVIWTLVPDNATYTMGTDRLAEMTIADLIELMFKDSFEVANP